MELKLNSILNLTEEEIENSKIELNMTDGSGVETFLNRWLMSSTNEKMKARLNAHIGAGMVISVISI